MSHAVPNISFIVRLNGQVSLCDQEMTCPSVDCSRKVFFAERYTTLQLKHGLYDKEIQEKVLAAGATVARRRDTLVVNVTGKISQERKWWR